MQENRNEILKTEIEVKGAENVSTDGVDILVSLKNTGSTKIGGDFTYMDIIVAYEKESNSMETVWIPLSGRSPLRKQLDKNGNHSGPHKPRSL